MAKGKATVNYLGRSGVVMPQTVPSWDFIYETSLIKHPKYELGDRVVLPDGRVYRYAKATNAITRNKYGVRFWNQFEDGITLCSLTAAVAKGAKSVSVAGTFTEDQLRGGYMIFHQKGTNYQQQFRGIIGNTATDTSGNIIIYLDAALQALHAGDAGVEVYPNPYSSVRASSSEGGYGMEDYSSVAGMPNVLTTVANQYLWIQTWGPIWINPHGTMGATGPAAGERRVVFDWEGSICENTDSDHGGSADEVETQLAGFIINRAGVAGDALLINLQINP